ncbi:GNAT family N-acetyltransferase [Actinomadura kijaniata]|uniref:GNAT family N-acetyltransferase n=1 Tax=Actinomadura kijaniata TaxID=46161 RepID=UPI000AEFCE98|nr:GNAT family N-acetyltransferase [Actinomadura kijaniata]
MRPYTGPADLRAMQELARRLPDPRLHPGELAWSRFQHLGREPEWRTALWEDDGRVVAWGWARPGHLDLQYDPARPELADAVLRWSDRAVPGGEREVTALDTETPLIEALRRHGYRERRDGPFFVSMRLDLADLADPKVPDGYTLRPVRGEEDAGARAAVHRAAFSLPGHPPSRVTAESYRQVMRAWPYRAGLDWLVEAPDGTPAAFCLVWLDGGTAVLEPVGTDPAHRRRGLASAAILAALRAARDLGATTARVTARGDDGHPSARATYASLGFHTHARTLSFTRP